MNGQTLVYKKNHVIPLNDVVVETCSPEDHVDPRATNNQKKLQAPLGKPNAFKIIMPGGARVYYFAAMSEDDRAQWVGGINNNVGVLRGGGGGGGGGGGQPMGGPPMGGPPPPMYGAPPPGALPQGTPPGPPGSPPQVVAAGAPQQVVVRPHDINEIIEATVAGFVNFVNVLTGKKDVIVVQGDPGAPPPTYQQGPPPTYQQASPPAGGERGMGDPSQQQGQPQQGQVVYQQPAYTPAGAVAVGAWNAFATGVNTVAHNVNQPQQVVYVQPPPPPPPEQKEAQPPYQ